MSRKDYCLIAAVIKENVERSNRVELFRMRELALTFATELAATNPRFDRTRFLAACGVEA